VTKCGLLGGSGRGHHDESRSGMPERFSNVDNSGGVPHSWIDQEKKVAPMYPLFQELARFPLPFLTGPVERETGNSVLILANQKRPWP